MGAGLGSFGHVVAGPFDVGPLIFWDKLTGRYNSAVFYSLGPSVYTILAAGGQSIGGGIGESGEESWKQFDSCFGDVLEMDRPRFNEILGRPDLERLDVVECVDVFAKEYVSGQNMLILVTDTPMPPGEPLAFMGRGNLPGGGHFKWMCDPRTDPMDCTPELVKQQTGNGKDWNVQPLQWAYPDVRLEVPLQTGFSNRTGSVYVNQGSEDDTVDVRTLNKFLDQKLNTTELQTELDDPSNWVNTSFAENVRLYNETYHCGETSMTRRYPWRQNRTYEVEHCVTVPQKESCQLFFSLPICLVVLGCNLAKLVCAVLTARDQREDVLLTIGDAIASFLDRPDSSTAGCCFLSKPLIAKGAQGWHESGINLDTDGRRLALAPPRPHFWFQAVEKGRWILTIALYVPFLFN